MTLTEEEAKTKWCPHAFTFGSLTGPNETNYGPQNRGFQMKGPLVACECIASKCMSWRWVDDTRMTRADGQPLEPGRAYHKDDILHTTVRERGYCGLAGTP